MTSTIDALTAGYRDSLATVPYGADELLCLPTAYASGSLVEILIRRHAGTVFLSDRGTTADELADAGVDIDAPRVWRSFKAVRDSVGLPPVLGAEPWEITATVDEGDLAVAVHAIAAAAMRADGLNVLSAAPRARSFGDTTIARLADRAAIVPRAQMPGRHGEARRVTLSYAGNDEQQFFIQALGGRDSETRSRSYDHASGLFLGAKPDVRHRVAVLQDGKWDTWQRRNLTEVCQVIDEDDVDDFVSATAAA